MNDRADTVKKTSSSNLKQNSSNINSLNSVNPNESLFIYKSELLDLLESSKSIEQECSIIMSKNQKLISTLEKILSRSRSDNTIVSVPNSILKKNSLQLDSIDNLNLDLKAILNCNSKENTEEKLIRKNSTSSENINKNANNTQESRRRRIKPGRTSRIQTRENENELLISTLQEGSKYKKFLKIKRLRDMQK